MQFMDMKTKLCFKEKIINHNTVCLAFGRIGSSGPAFTQCPNLPLEPRRPLARLDQNTPEPHVGPVRLLLDDSILSLQIPLAIADVLNLSSFANHLNWQINLSRDYTLGMRRTLYEFI